MEISIFYCLLISSLLYFLTKHMFFTKRNVPPSPGLSLPLIGHLHLLGKPLHKALAEISGKYGPVLLLHFGSRPVLEVSSRSAAEESLSKNDIIFANRPRLTAGKYVGYNYTTLAWNSYGALWRDLRRIASAELLSSKPLQMSTELRAGEIKSLIRRLFRCSNNGGFVTVNMKAVLFEFLLNVMMAMIAGKRYSESEKLKELVAETFELSGVTNIVDFIPALKWVGFRKKEKRLMMLQRKWDEFLLNLIEECRRTRRASLSDLDRKSKTMIDVLLELQEKDPEYYTEDIIKGLLHVMITAGTDTTAGTLEWALSLLLNNPDAIVKAQNEIDINIAESKAHLIEESDLLKLPYLQCIIDESLRMYPVGPLLAPHESSEDCTVGGFKVARGTMLLVNIWAIQNDPELWDEPTMFKPERFQKPEKEKNQLNMLPFGMGRRGCPGEGLATRMVGVTLGSLMQCFEWKRDGEKMVDMSEGDGVVVPKIRPLMAKCRPRPTMAKFLSEL